MKQVTINKKLQQSLRVRYEYQGFNGEKHIRVPIMYDPKTGFIYDIGDIYDIKGDDDVQCVEQTKVQDK
jgi:hypothetical protein